jgi:hypothetical protein
MASRAHLPCVVRDATATLVSANAPCVKMSLEGLGFQVSEYWV